MNSDTVTWKEYVDTKFDAQEKQVALALNAADRAVLKAEAANERRFEGVNEFRSTLADQQRTLMPRIEAEVLIKALQEKVMALETALLKKSSQGQGRGEVIAWIVAAVSFVGALLAIVFRFM